MKFFIETVPIFFPFNIIYPEQIQLMYILKKLFDNNCHGIISLPPCTNFPISTISFFLSYRVYSKLKTKLVYCSSSNGEIEEIISKSNVFSKRFSISNLDDLKIEKPTILTWPERDRLCINSKIQNRFKNNEIDDICKSLISPFFFSCSNKKKSKFFGQNIISYFKKPLRCFYFYNLQRKKILSSLRGVWSTDKLIRYGLKRKICPFFFLEKKVKESSIIITRLDKVFYPSNVDFFRNKRFSSSFLIFDNVFGLEKSFFKYSQFKINSLILEDCKRSLMILQKRKNFINFFQKKEETYDILLDFFSNQNLKNKKISEFEHQTGKFFQFSSGAFNRNIVRIFHLFELVRDLINGFEKFFQIPFDYKCSMKEFENFLFSDSRMCSFSCGVLKTFPFFFFQILSSFGIFQYRLFNGLKAVMNFTQLMGIFLESSNQNLSVIFSPFVKQSEFFSEPFLILESLEKSHFLRTIFENFKVLLICADFLGNNDFYISQLDCFIPIRGDLQLVFKKKFILSNWTSLIIGNSFKFSNMEKKLEVSILKNFSFLLARILENSHHGIICFFPIGYPLIRIVKNWEKDKTFKEILKGREIFIETLDLEANLSAIENFKFCCDIGRKAIFLGTFQGILMRARLNNHYRRIILLFGDLFQKTVHEKKKNLENFFKKKSKFSLDTEIGAILNKFYKSKFDFGAFFVIETKKEINKKRPISPRLNIFGKKKNFRNLDEISKELKNFFFSWNTNL